MYIKKSIKEISQKNLPLPHIDYLRGIKERLTFVFGKIIRIQNAFKTRFPMAVLHFTYHENYIVSTGLYLIDINLLSHQMNRQKFLQIFQGKGKYELSQSIKFKTCEKWQNWQKSGGKLIQSISLIQSIILDCQGVSALTIFYMHTVDKSFLTNFLFQVPFHFLKYPKRIIIGFRKMLGGTTLDGYQTVPVVANAG